MPPRKFLDHLRLNLRVILAVYQNTINISLIVVRVTALLGYLNLEALVSRGPIKGFEGMSSSSRKFL